MTQAATTKTAEINSKVLDYVEKTGEALGVALRIAEASDLSKQAASERIPRVVEQLKKAGLIGEHEVKQAQQQLASPAQSLDILADVLTHFAETQPTKSAGVSLGQGETHNVPSSGVDKQANFVGHRRGYGDDMPESDQVLLKFLHN